jgi:hypothetical protein
MLEIVSPGSTRCVEVMQIVWLSGDWCGSQIVPRWTFSGQRNPEEFGGTSSSEIVTCRLLRA